MSNTPERTVTRTLHRPALAVEVAAHLVIVEGNNIGKAYLLTEQATIGRSPDATFPLDDPGVSRFHARVSRHPSGGFVLQDLDSHNGTFVNGLRLKLPRLLQFGDKIGLGSSITLMFVYRDLIDEQLLLSQKLESIGRLAGGIAHDFNNLLGAMISGLEFVLDLPERLAPDARDCLGDVLAAARRGTELTCQLLGFARQGKHQPVPFDLSGLVREVLQLVRRAFDPAIVIESDITPEICVLGEPGQLHQVVMNLCLNARDAMPDGGTLRLQLSATEIQPRDVPPPQVAPGHYATLVVTDTGHGMDETAHNQAFEPFFTTKAAGFGTGLGLSTVHGIVTRHGGWIRLESAPHAGCRFWVYLPLTPDDPAAASSDVPGTGLGPTGVV